MSAAAEGSGAVSYREAAELLSRVAAVFPNPSGESIADVRAAAPALRALAGLVERITEAVATDERALTLTDPSARASEQQYAEEEILQAAVSIAAGFQPEGEGHR